MFDGDDSCLFLRTFNFNHLVYHTYSYQYNVTFFHSLLSKLSVSHEENLFIFPHLAFFCYSSYKYVHTQKKKYNKKKEIMPLF